MILSCCAKQYTLHTIVIVVNNITVFVWYATLERVLTGENALSDWRLAVDDDTLVKRTRTWHDCIAIGLQFNDSRTQPSRWRHVHVRGVRQNLQAPGQLKAAQVIIEPTTRVPFIHSFICLSVLAFERTRRSEKNKNKGRERGRERERERENKSIFLNKFQY